MIKKESVIAPFLKKHGFHLFLILYFSIHAIWAFFGGPYFPNDDSKYHIDAIQGIFEKGYPAGKLAWEGQSHECGYYAHPPLYAYLAAFPAIFLGRAFGARILSCTASTFAMILLRRLGDRYYPGSGIFAAILYGMNPVMFFYTSTAQFEPTVCFFGVLAMYLASNGDEPSRMLAAVAVGCAFLTKETGVFFLFPILIRCFLDNNDWKLAVKSSLKVIIITGIFAAIFPILAWFTCWKAFEMQFLFHFDRARWPLFSFVFFIINNALVIAPILFCDLKAFKKDKDLSIGLIGGFGLFYIFLTRKYHTIALPLTVPLAILAGKGVQNKIRQPQYLFLGFGFTVLFAYFLGYYTVSMADFCCLYNKYGYTLQECVFGYIYLSLFALSFWVIVNCIRIMLNSLKAEPNKSN